MKYAATPSEDYECSLLVKYLESKKLLFTHINSSQFTRSFAIKSKNTRMGVRTGAPDYVIVLPDAPVKPFHSLCRVVFIEMKKVRGGVVSPAQREWINALTAAGAPAKVCKGFEEAKKFIEELLA